MFHLKKYFPFFPFSSSFSFIDSFKKPTNQNQHPNKDVLAKSTSLPPKVHYLAHMQLLGNEHSSTPSLGICEHSITFSFWTKAYLNTYEKEKGDADHCPYSDLLWFLRVIPEFTLNYCSFALLKIPKYLEEQKFL